MWNVFKELLYKVKKKNKSTYYTCDLIIWKWSNYILYKHSGIYEDFFNKIIVATATILFHYAVSRKYAGILKKLSLYYVCFSFNKWKQIQAFESKKSIF